MIRWAASFLLALTSVIYAAQAADIEYRLLTLDGHRVAWPTSPGQPLTLTWALAARETDFPTARNCQKILPVENLVAASGITKDAFRREVLRALSLWQNVTAVSFREADDPAKADILIGAQADPEGWAYADVFFDKAAASPVKPITRGLVCLNPAQRWKVGFDGNLKSYDLRYTLAHEIGHTIGLDHPNRSGQVMSYRYEEKFTGLQAGDVAGAVQLYGSQVGRRLGTLAEQPTAPPVPTTTMGLQ